MRGNGNKTLPPTAAECPQNLYVLGKSADFEEQIPATNQCTLRMIDRWSFAVDTFLVPRWPPRVGAVDGENQFPG